MSRVIGLYVILIFPYNLIWPSAHHFGYEWAVISNMMLSMASSVNDYITVLEMVFISKNS